MEIARDKDFKHFIDNVRKGYELICEFHNLLSVEIPEEQQCLDPQKEQNAENKIVKAQNLILMDERGQPIKSQFTFEQLASSTNPSLEKTTFRRIFTKDKSTKTYNIQLGFRNGYGFYALAQELLSFLNVCQKNILIDQPLNQLDFNLDSDDSTLDSATKNFLVNFAVAIIYLSYFNILMIVHGLESCKKEYKRGERLMSINIQETIDIKKLLVINDFYDLLFYFDLYYSNQVPFKLEETFCKIKDKLHTYCEIFQQIEGNIHSLFAQNVNSSYLQFILCVSLYHSEFEEHYTLLEEDSNKNFIGNLKVNLDRYLEEIVNYGIDYTHNPKNRNEVKNWMLFNFREILSIMIDSKSHLLLELFDEKLYQKLTFLVKNYEREAKDPGKNKKRNPEKLNEILNGVKNIGLVAINLKCSPKNRYNQVDFIHLVEDVQRLIMKLIAENERNQ